MDNQQSGPTPKTLPNAIIWIVLIIVLIIVAIGIYLWWQSGETNTNVNSVANANSLTNSAHNDNANDAFVIRTNDLGAPESYTNDLLGFTISNPDHLNVVEIIDDPDRMSTDEYIPLVCASNYEQDDSLHPQSGEINVCFNAFLSRNNDLTSWYENYSQRGISNYNLYESVTTKEVEVNGYKAVQARIATGEHPREPVDTGWFDGQKLEYYFLLSGYILQVETIVHSDDVSLLEYASNTVNTIEFN